MSLTHTWTGLQACSLPVAPCNPPPNPSTVRPLLAAPLPDSGCKQREVGTCGAGDRRWSSGRGWGIRSAPRWTRSWCVESCRQADWRVRVQERRRDKTALSVPAPAPPPLSHAALPLAQTRAWVQPTSHDVTGVTGWRIHVRTSSPEPPSGSHSSAAGSHDNSRVAVWY